MDLYNKEFEKLNEYQKAAVEDPGQYVLLNAAVGSGKTTVLVHKILYLHLVCKIQLEDMVVLTFTNRAANEMKSRIKLFLGENCDLLKYFGTFHSVARLILNECENIEKTGYNKGFDVIDTNMAYDMLNSIIEEGRLNIKYKAKLLKRVEEFKNGKPLYGVMKKADDIDELVRIYIEEKQKRNAMDFDDIIQNCIGVLEKPLNPEWIIIDEFQDTDLRQFELIKKIAGKDTSIFCIGDPNQIIYSWRTGSENIFNEFKREYKPKELGLPLNYRSTKTIIEAANSFLYGSLVEGIRDYGSNIKIIQHHDAFNEAHYIAGIVRSFNDQGIPYKQMAVLYRRQAQLEVLLDVLCKENIPCNIMFKSTLPYEEPEGFENDGDGVNLLTLHASKGLEFSNVFIIGANMGNIPLSSRKTDEPEELRLFYVGMTRAKSYLEISYLKNPSLKGATPYKSPYLSMIPQRLLSIEEENKGNTSLKDLMEILREERSKKDTVQSKRAKHAKYGIGAIIYEDDAIIKVKFEEYGEKEFSKMFCPLEYIC